MSLTRTQRQRLERGLRFARLLSRFLDEAEAALGKDECTAILWSWGAEFLTEAANHPLTGADIVTLVNRRLADSGRAAGRVAGRSVVWQLVPFPSELLDAAGLDSLEARRVPLNTTAH
jgi:hypothetical protein